MYLAQLYKQHKYWFIVVLLFIAGQLFINAKKGMVCSPFFHYGMYSAPMPADTSYMYLEVWVNNEQLKPSDFSPQRWDKIIQPVLYFSRQQQENNYQFNEAHRILGINDTAKFINRITKRDFDPWYRQYLGSILGKQVLTININYKIAPAGKSTEK